ncbi:MAG: PAS domain S-box protein, partial [Erysipelotrichaceae bacterium]|nr:PAS domain S-box protein [Erysipelotrichaceae bacterium]
IGATDFIVKPFNKQDIINRVKSHLNFRIQLQFEQDNLYLLIEKEKRAAELVIANKELLFQNEEKEKRAAELIIANEELLFQNEEKEKRAAELIIANEELLFQNEEKEKRAAELVIANEELLFQNEEKEKRAAELIIANKELLFQNKEKVKRAAELIIANKELLYQNEEKGKRAAELIIANNELALQSKEIEQKTKELLLAREQIEMAGVIINRAWRYNQSLIEASIDPILTIDENGEIIGANTAVENATGLTKNELIGTSFWEIFSDPEKARSYYQMVFELGQSFNYELNLKHINGFTTPVIYNAFVYSDNDEKRVGVMVANNDITTKQKDEIVYLQINLNLLIKQRMHTAHK